MIDEVEAKKIVKLAERSIQLVALIRKGKSLEEIVEATNSYPNIVRYYQRRLLKKTV